MVPRENKNNAYAKFGGTNKEYYGIFRNGQLYQSVFGRSPADQKPEDCFLQYGNHIQNQLQTFDILTWKHRHISCCRLSLPKFILFYFSVERNSTKYVCVSSLLLSKCALFYLWLILCTLFLDEYHAWTANQTLFLRYWFGPCHWRCIGTVLARISLGKKKHTYLPIQNSYIFHNTKFVHTLLIQHDFNH